MENMCTPNNPIKKILVMEDIPGDLCNTKMESIDSTDWVIVNCNWCNRLLNHEIMQDANYALNCWHCNKYILIKLPINCPYPFSHTFKTHLTHK